MKLSEFDYNLPNNLIAHSPAAPRDASKLMAINKKSAEIKHSIFIDLPEFLKKDDLLIFNNSMVIPARLMGRKDTGGRIEVLLLKQEDNDIWEVLINKKMSPCSKITFSKNFWGVILSLPKRNKKWLIKFNASGKTFKNYLYKHGDMPLPPYIKSKERASKTKKQYQTIYADPKKEGSVAAPTAGLHFTNRLLKKLKRNGIQTEFITLHVGLGTFQPVRSKNIKDHQMHPELVEINKKTLRVIVKAKKDGRRIISVGTTTARALESLPLKISTSKDYSKWVNIFIYPGYKFKYINGMITNFHLPKSTLLMMVSAFAGSDIIKKAYREAIKNKYRFYSFGDAMLII